MQRNFDMTATNDWKRAEEIWGSNLNADLKERIMAVLTDYTKNDSSLARFFNFHPNRHHVNDFNAVCIFGKNKSVFDMVSLLNELTIDNKQGTAAIYIEFINKKIAMHNQAQFELALRLEVGDTPEIRALEAKVAEMKQLVKVISRMNNVDSRALDDLDFKNARAPRKSF